MISFYRFNDKIYELPPKDDQYTATISYVEKSSGGHQFKQEKFYGICADCVGDASRKALSLIASEKMPRVQSINYQVN